MCRAIFHCDYYYLSAKFPNPPLPHVTCIFSLTFPSATTDSENGRSWQPSSRFTPLSLINEDLFFSLSFFDSASYQNIPDLNFASVSERLVHFPTMNWVLFLFNNSWINLGFWINCSWIWVGVLVLRKIFGKFCYWVLVSGFDLFVCKISFFFIFLHGW